MLFAWIFRGIPKGIKGIYSSLSDCGVTTNQNKKNSRGERSRDKSKCVRTPESMGEQEKAISPEPTSGALENGVWNDLSDGWQSAESPSAVAEFDEWLLGSLNAELYTIPFSSLNTGTLQMKACVCVSKPGPSETPGEGWRLQWGGQSGEVCGDTGSTTVLP